MGIREMVILILTVRWNGQHIGNDSNYRSKCICHHFDTDSVDKFPPHRCPWQVCIYNWNLKRTKSNRSLNEVISLYWMDQWPNQYCRIIKMTRKLRTWLNPNGGIQCQMICVGGFLSNVYRIQIRCNVNRCKCHKCVWIIVFIQRR